MSKKLTVIIVVAALYSIIMSSIALVKFHPTSYGEWMSIAKRGPVYILTE